MEEFSIVPLPELNTYTITNKDMVDENNWMIAGEETTYIQGIFNFIDSPAETWLFCKYLEQELIQYHVFYDGSTEENPDENYVVWNPGHIHFDKRI